MASFALQTSNVAVGNDATSVHCFRTLADGVMRIGLDDDSISDLVYFDGSVEVLGELTAVTLTSNAFTSNSFAVNVITATDLTTQTANITDMLTANNFTVTNTFTTTTNTTATTVSNVLTANIATISGNLTANNATITNVLTANNATISGNLTANIATISGDLTANNATITNVLTANNATISGNLTANNATVSNVLTANVVTLSGALNIAGVTETINEKTGATGVVVHDFTTGALWRHISIASNFTINMTNVPTTVSKVTSINLILVQGGTAYYANACQIAGVSQTINWLGAALPTATASGTDIQNLTLVRSAAGAWSVMSSLSGFKTAA